MFEFHGGWIRTTVLWTMVIEKTEEEMKQERERADSPKGRAAEGMKAASDKRRGCFY